MVKSGSIFLLITAMIIGNGGEPPFATTNNWPHSPEAEHEAACQFILLARNTGSADRFADLYTSTVYRWNVPLGGLTQLKIQNHRIGPGKTISRSYTSPGRCNVKRLWKIYFRNSTNGQTMMIVGYTSSSTRVDSSGRRVLQLGDARYWKDRETFQSDP